MSTELGLLCRLETKMQTDRQNFYRQTDYLEQKVSQVLKQHVPLLEEERKRVEKKMQVCWRSMLDGGVNHYLDGEPLPSMPGTEDLNIGQRLKNIQIRLEPTFYLLDTKDPDKQLHSIGLKGVDHSGYDDLTRLPMKILEHLYQHVS